MKHIVGDVVMTEEEICERNVEFLKNLVKELEAKKAKATSPEVIANLEQTIATFKKDIEA